MSLRPTFLGFETMRKALSVSQKCLDITGSNLSNVHTLGYSRQRLDLFSINTPGGNLRYNTSIALAGQGVDASGVAQIRDPFLDKRFRELNSDSADVGIESKTLTDIENVLDSIDTEGFTTAFADFKSTLSKFALENPNRPELANIARQSALQMVQSIRGYNTKLNQISDQTKFELEAGVSRCSAIFKQIGDLNDQIVNGYVASGDITLEGNEYKANTTYGPNELKDMRNNLLDELSNYGNVKVTNNDDGSIGVDFGQQRVVEGKKYKELISEVHETGAINISVKDISGLTTYLKPDDSGLFTGALKGYLDMYNGAGAYSQDISIRRDGVKAMAGEANDILSQIAELNKTGGAVPTELEDKLKEYGDFTITPATLPDVGNVVTLGGVEVVSQDGMTINKISVGTDATNENITITVNGEAVVAGAGKFTETIAESEDNYFNSTAGIVYYKNSINALANTLVRSFNEANSDPNFVDADGNYFIRAMFSPSDRGEDITAANISISDEWLKDASLITKKIEGVYDDTGVLTGIKSVTPPMEELLPDSLNRLIANTVKKLSFTINNDEINAEDKTIDDECTFDAYLANRSNQLGKQLEFTNGVYDATDSMAMNIQNQRNGVMSVSINEEGQNMMTFQKWLNASSRMMTTFDEALNTIISSMGLVGR